MQLTDDIIAEPEVAVVRDLDPDLMLVLPMARSVSLERGVDAAGAAQLTLWHRDREITFDDPRHFGFGEALAGRASFRAGEAAEWGDIGWTEARALLVDLVDAGILRPASETDADGLRHDNQPQPSPLPPAPMAQPRSWTDPESLMMALTGTDLDPAYLELVVPVFRTAHVYVDRDGRQVGEANVFPMTARIDVATDWRGCPYPGNRYQPEKPMNVTALRAMRQHWRPMMTLLAAFRTAFLERFPQARQGWTVGDVERLTTAVLALPGYMVLRRDHAVANGDLHPALSNLFRVTDGLRMVMHQMLFVPTYEAMLAPDAPITAAAVLAYADRNYSFHSEHGVCAGPRFMIEDFLGVILDGVEPRGGAAAALDDELQAVTVLIEPAIAYAMYGLQAFGTVFSLWPAMTRCYEQLHGLLESAGDPTSGLAERFARHFASLGTRSFLASEAWRQHREAVYDDMYGQCFAAVAGKMPDQPLSAMLAPDAAAPLRAPATLVAAVTARLGDQRLSQQFADSIMDFLARAQRIVAHAETIQAGTARLLRRPAPAHRLTLAQLNLHNVLMGEAIRTVPFLPAEITALFGVDVHVDAGTIEISFRPQAGGITDLPGTPSGK